MNISKWNSKYDKTFNASCDDYKKNIEVIQSQLPQIKVNTAAISTLPSILDSYANLKIPSSSLGKSIIIKPSKRKEFVTPTKNLQETPHMQENQFINDDLSKSYELKRQLIYSSLQHPDSNKKVSFLERERIDLVKSGGDFSK